MRIELKNITLNQYINLERGNRYAAASKKKKLTEAVQWQVMKYRNQIDPTGLYDLTIYWIVPDNRTDPDNVYFLKPILDGLVKAKILKDDNRKHVRNISHRIRTVKGKSYIIIRFRKI
jgi:Holliday junction resolvase RusA-like endonuclease